MRSKELMVRARQHQLQERLRNIGYAHDEIKREVVQDTLRRNTALMERAWTINESFGQSADRDGPANQNGPIVLLGELKGGGQLRYSAVQLSTYDTHRKRGRHSYIDPKRTVGARFHGLTEAGRDAVRLSPFGSQQDNHLSFDEYVELAQEETLTSIQMHELERSPGMGARFDSPIRLPAYFNPVGVLSVAVQVRKASMRLDRFEENLNIIEAVAGDPIPNPQLATMMKRQPPLQPTSSVT